MSARRLLADPKRAAGVRALLGAAVLLGTVAGAVSCGDSSDYKYIEVTVNIDRATVSMEDLLRVTTCELAVRGVETASGIVLRCSEGQVPYELGKLQWSTTADVGSLVFIVGIYDINHQLIGEGQSPSVSLSSSMEYLPPTSVTVVGVAQTGP
jgi:hypothetical protein